MTKKLDLMKILIALVVLIALGNLIQGKYEAKKQQTAIEETSTFDPYRMSRSDDLGEHIAGVAEDVRSRTPDAVLTDVVWNESENRYELYFSSDRNDSIEYIRVW